MIQSAIVLEKRLKDRIKDVERKSLNEVREHTIKSGEYQDEKTNLQNQLRELQQELIAKDGLIEDQEQNWLSIVDNLKKAYEEQCDSLNDKVTSLELQISKMTEENQALEKNFTKLEGKYQKLKI